MKGIGEKLSPFQVVGVKPRFNDHEENGESAFEIINENNLCQYYDISKNPGITAKGKFNSEKFSYLEDEKIKQKLIIHMLMKIIIMRQKNGILM